MKVTRNGSFVKVEAPTLDMNLGALHDEPTEQTLRRHRDELRRVNERNQRRIDAINEALILNQSQWSQYEASRKQS